MTLWIPGEAEATSLLLNGVEIAKPAAEPVQNGHRITLDVPAGSEGVEILRSADGARWRLGIEEAPPAWDAPLRELLAKQAFDDGEEWLRAQLAGELTPAERGVALAWSGQYALRRGDVAEGSDLLRQSLPLLREAGDLQVEADRATVLVFTLIVREHRLAEARAQLDELPRDWAASGEVLYLDAYNRGLLAMTAGDARGALEHLESAVALAERMGFARFQRVAEEAVAIQLWYIGRRRESRGVLASLLGQTSQQEEPCRVAGLLGNLGLNDLQANIAGEPGPDPLDSLQAALQVLETGCAEDLVERQNALLNIALAHLEAGRSDQARAALAEAQAQPVATGVGLQLWWREIEGRLALVDGRPEAALSIYESLGQTARAALTPEAEWRAHLGRALAKRALGDPDGALEAFAEAEHQLDTEMLLVPLQGGRESLLAQRERATAQHLDLLLELGNLDNAVELTRRARLRVLRHLNRSILLRSLNLEQRALWDRMVDDYQRERAVIDRLAERDWQLAADALEATRRQREEARERLAQNVDATLAVLDPEGAVPRASLRPAQGVLALLFHPLPVGWATLARWGEETRVERRPCEGLGEQQLASCLIAPFGEWIAHASEVRILAPGRLGGIDFHAALQAGEMLLARAPVVYDLDLGDDTAGSVTELPDSALILADPTGDLPAARQEAGSVRRYLGKRLKARLTEGREATADALHRELIRHELFHFAGHAAFAGRGGWQTFLPLAEGGRLSLEDILLLDRVPRWVVLSGCETARTASAPAVAEQVGLAQAFAAAGSEVVLAATRPVDDWLAAEMVELYYSAWLGGESPGQALRRAQLSLREQHPGVDWASFRLIIR